MTYRSDLDALAARHAALEADVDARSRELADAKRSLDDAQARARLPVLDNIRVASPCPASWDAMPGDARVRACGDCKKHVYNLSELTRDEAEALIIEKEGRLCVRYFQRKDGTILLKDCVIGVRKRRRRRLVALGLAASAAAGVVTYKTMAHTAPEVVISASEPAMPMMGAPPVRAVAGGVHMMGDPMPEPPKPTVGHLAPPPPPHAKAKPHR